MKVMAGRMFQILAVALAVAAFLFYLFLGIRI